MLYNKTIIFLIFIQPNKNIIVRIYLAVLLPWSFKLAKCVGNHVFLVWTYNNILIERNKIAL